MSTNLNYKQVANVERRTWDLETYSKRAIERQKNAEGDSGTIMKKKKTKGGMPDTGGSGDGSGPGGDEEGLQQWKEEFQPAPKGAAGPEKSDRAFLKARRNKVDVDSKIGSVEIINPDAVATTKSIVGEPGSIKVCGRVHVYSSFGVSVDVESRTEVYQILNLSPVSQTLSSSPPNKGWYHKIRCWMAL